MKRIYLIDCPGVVAPAVDDKPVDIVLKGVVRVENLSQPEYYIPAVLERVRREYMGRTYEVKSWEDAEDFLGQVAKRTGKLLKGGEPDLGSVAKMVLNDWIRGRIPFYSVPPDLDGFEGAAEPGQAEGEKQQQPGVQQILSKIFVSAKYLPDDMNKEGEVVDDPEVVKAVEEAEHGTGKKERKRKVESTDWDEVFEGVVGEEVVDSIPGREAPAFIPDSDEEEDDEEEGEEEWESAEDSDEDVEEADDADNPEEADETLADSSSEEESEPITQKRRKLTVQKGRRKAGLPVFTVQEKETLSNSPPKKRRTEPKPKPQEPESSEDEQQPKKEARLTTNKGKVGTHYYETANVKNKNRNKVKPVDPNTLVKKLQSKGKVSGKVGKKGRR